MSAPRAHLAFPGDLATPTGGYEYDRRLLGAAEAAGLDLRPLPLPELFPAPSPAAEAEALRALAGAPGPVIVDGLALGVLAPEAWPEGLGDRLIALCHHPLGLETGLEAAEARHLLDLESRVLRACAGVIVTSAETARVLRDRLGVAAEKISVAPPGLEPAAPAARRGAPPKILGVGTLSARKDWPTLVGALSRLRDLDWTCVIAGADDRDPQAAQALRDAISRERLDGRVRLTGALPRAEIETLYAQADIFCLPSRHEGFGMAAVEAMARGLPVVAAEAGALPEATGGAALLPPPGDVAAWAETLGALLRDGELRDRLSAASQARAARLPGWADTARIVAAAVARITDKEAAR